MKADRLPTRTSRRAVLAVTCALGLAASGAVSAPAGQAPPGVPSRSIGRLPVDLTHARTREALETAVEEGAPGTLAEARVGHHSWWGTTGVSDLVSRRPRQRFDRFRTASVTKTFTATVLLQLEAEGRLSLDDTVERWLPGLVHGQGNDGGRITLRQLLDHTSGLFSYDSDPWMSSRITGRPFLTHRYDSYSPTRLVRIALRHPPRRPPGARWSYSNTNYLIAGLVIEKVTGSSWAAEVRRRILTPLGLRATSVPGSGPGLPRPHGRHYSRLLLKGTAAVYDVTEGNPSLTWSAGSLISTTGDLVRFYDALFAGRLLPRKQMREMFTGVPTGRGGPRGRYGLGVLSRELSCGITVWGHDGAVHGSLTWVMGVPGGGHTLALNINGDWVDRRRVSLAVSEAEFCPGGTGRSMGSGSGTRDPAGPVAVVDRYPERDRGPSAHSSVRVGPPRGGSEGDDIGCAQPRGVGCLVVGLAL